MSTPSSFETEDADLPQASKRNRLATIIADFISPNWLHWATFFISICLFPQLTMSATRGRPLWVSVVAIVPMIGAVQLLKRLSAEYAIFWRKNRTQPVLPKTGIESLRKLSAEMDLPIDPQERKILLKSVTGIFHNIRPEDDPRMDYDLREWMEKLISPLQIRAVKSPEDVELRLAVIRAMEATDDDLYAWNALKRLAGIKPKSEEEKLLRDAAVQTQERISERRRSAQESKVLLRSDSGTAVQSGELLRPTAKREEEVEALLRISSSPQDSEK